jgi:hypothetical protein
LPPPRSDHDAVVCCIRLPHERTYGPGLWRADAGLLADAGVAAALAATWGAAKASCPVQLPPSPAPAPSPPPPTARATPTSCTSSVAM